MSPAAAILTIVTVQRFGELLLAGRNTQRLLAKGAVEFGAGHYPFLVAVHVLWLTGLWWFARSAAVNLSWLAAYGVLQAARVWILLTLGDRWTTRIIVLPAAPLIRRGPYRFLTHPNYAVVTGEIAVLPLVFGLWWYALIFSCLNALVLAVRIREENRALPLG